MTSRPPARSRRSAGGASDDGPAQGTLPLFDQESSAPTARSNAAEPVGAGAVAALPERDATTGTALATDVPERQVREGLPLATIDAGAHRAAPARDAQAEPHDLAQLWLAQAFAERLAAFAEREGAPPQCLDAVRKAAHAVSMATSSGHACVELTTVADEHADAAQLRTPLLASRVVGTSAEPGACPLVLDGADRLYLHRYFDYERRIARRLAARETRGFDDASAQRMAARLDELFGANAPALGAAVDWQKVAAALAVGGDFTVISGGPGTGKTTTVVNLLACILAIEPDCRIALAAPTGKAAARMQDAIRERAAHLPPDIQARLPAESFTIHRLLGVRPDGNAFRHDAANPLPLDVLVVDEASMLDLALAAKLFDAVPRGARIVLLGDKDQLAAVESGAVFSELSADPTLTPSVRGRLARLCGIAPERIVPPAPAKATALHDAVVWFTHNFRFAADSGIGRLAREVNAGRADDALNVLRAAADGSMTWYEDAEYAPAPSTLDTLRERYAPYLRALCASCTSLAGGAALEAIFEAFDRFRVLCAERAGPRGVRALNEAIGSHFRQAMDAQWPTPARSPWFCGRPVMVLRNDYVLKLYNGDVGITLPDRAGNLMVNFRQTDGSVRAIAPVRLPEHEPAFATTVHKAQGSEFDEVAVVLPARPSRVLTRELLYTAITRARRRVVLVSGEQPLRVAIAARTVRHSGLVDRIREAMGGG